MEETAQIILSWRSALLAMVIFPLLICAAALLVRSVERQAMLWFSLFLFAASLTAIPFLIGFSGAYNVWPGLTFLPVQLPLFFGPLIYIHAYKLMIGGPLGWRKYLLVPGILDWLYQLWAFTMLGDYTAKWAFNNAVHAPFILPIVTLLSVVLMGFAVIAIYKLYRKYIDWLPGLQSNDDSLNPVWLKHFFILTTMAAAIWGLDLILSFSGSYSYADSFGFSFCALLFALFLALESLSRAQTGFPKLLRDSVAATEKSDVEKLGVQKDWKAEGEKIAAAVTEHQWFLEPGLSLTQLSRRVGMNRAYLSRALNEGLDTNFSDFINAMRVRYAKVLIDDGDMKMLDIALAAGFGSKASFNRVFRRLAGKTPSQFRDGYVS